jgi:hypothetical protein
MQSEESLRVLIRERLTSGVLPGGDCMKVLGDPSNGETCDGRGEPVAKNNLVIECVGSHFPRALQFHVRCFYIWDSESGTQGACPSTPTDG